MDEEIESAAEAAAAPAGPGEKLRAAREALGMDLAQVAAETRIPQRHLKLIEAGAFADLPAKTYAVGFARSYARAVELDGDAIAEEVRAELAGYEPDAPYRQATFEPGDPARVPGSRIIWIAGGAVLVLLVAVWFGYNSLFAPAGELPSLIAEETPAPRPAANAARPAAQPPAGGAVVFTALDDDVWVKFYDAEGNQLVQKVMAKGETYTLPADAQGPQVWTGRPDALAITIGGRPVRRLGEDDVIVKDVPVSAAALLARPPLPPSPVPTASPAPAPTPTPRPSAT